MKKSEYSSNDPYYREYLKQAEEELKEQKEVEEQERRDYEEYQLEIADQEGG